ncbi:LacI family DNA-binding transcriptional regulator [Coprobacter tertius]|uniref:LacI family transcriptional regulator n=1 Tax=Coprobacter tertius TaxID=2944915 RepID=A0ABT1MJ94_9BACT|nr:LacI family DNA-binding transcriptional regulator [Coprobacter tertius]MCP9612129.1 LacI family transcriptional regulator [Coprobacter tertius]
MGNLRKVTIYDLAKELNTSASTVSRALQNHPRISVKMKAAVLELAEKMNYHPDPVAHHLRTGKGLVLGVVVPRIDRHFFSSVIGGIESVAYANGYGVLVSQSNEKYEDEKSIVKTMMAKKIDGLAVSLASETIDYSHFENVMKNRIPLVFFDRVPLSHVSCTVEVDNFTAAYKVVCHLISQGCKRIAHLAGPLSISVYRQRYEGYLKALEDSGLKMMPELIIENSITLVTGEAAGIKILDMHVRPDGVFSAGDYSAIGLIHALKDGGLSVPEDIAVVGFANEPFDSFVDPPLSSVDQRNNEMGKNVAELLLSKIADPDNMHSIEHMVLDTNLVVRKSSLKW